MSTKTQDEMTSSKPYLFRAIHDWLVDNQLTPFVRIDNTRAPGVQVPPQFATGGPLVLNIAAHATAGLEFSDFGVTFAARFQGTSHDVRLPWHSIVAVFSQENGAGMLFPEAEIPAEHARTEEVTLAPPAQLSADETPAETQHTRPGRAHLRVVK